MCQDVTYYFQVAEQSVRHSVDEKRTALSIKLASLKVQVITLQADSTKELSAIKTLAEDLGARIADFQSSQKKHLSNIQAFINILMQDMSELELAQALPNPND